MIDDAIRQLRKVEFALLLACLTEFAGLLFARPTQAHRALEQLGEIMRLFPDSPLVAENAGDVAGVWKPNWLYDYVSKRLASDSTLEPLRYDDQWWRVRDGFESRDLAHALHLEGLLWTAHERSAQCRQDEEIEFLFVARPGDFEAQCMRPFERPTTLREFVDGWRVLAEPLTVYVARGLSSDAARITWFDSKLPRGAARRQVELRAYPDRDFPERNVIWERAASGDTYPRRVFRAALVHDTLLKFNMDGSDTSSLFIVNLADYVPNSRTSLLVARVLSLERRVFDKRIAFASVHELDWPPFSSIDELFPDLTALAGVLARLRFADLRGVIESEVMRTSQRSVEVLGQRLWGVDIARFGGLAILGIHWYFLVQLMLLVSEIKPAEPFSSDVAWLALSSHPWAQFTVIVANVLVPLGALALAVWVLCQEGGQNRWWALMLLAGLMISGGVFAKLRCLHVRSGSV